VSVAAFAFLLVQTCLLAFLQIESESKPTKSIDATVACLTSFSFL